VAIHCDTAGVCNQEFEPLGIKKRKTKSSFSDNEKTEKEKKNACKMFAIADILRQKLQTEKEIKKVLAK